MGNKPKKGKKKGRKGTRKSSLRSETSSLSLAYRLTRKVSSVGFDWPDVTSVLGKLDEELKEFREALRLQNRKKMREELGDLLFVLVNLARFLRMDPEQALRGTIQKFVRRFHYVETSLRREGKSLRHSNIFEMDRLWEEAKEKPQGLTPPVRGKGIFLNLK